VIGVVAIVLVLVDAERERLGPQRVAPDTDNHGRIGVLEQVQRRVNAERAATAENCILLHSFPLILRDHRKLTLENRPVPVACVSGALEELVPALRVIVVLGSQDRDTPTSDL
jgi:hypothetical protein